MRGTFGRLRTLAVARQSTEYCRAYGSIQSDLNTFLHFVGQVRHESQPTSEMQELKSTTEVQPTWAPSDYDEILFDCMIKPATNQKPKSDPILVVDWMMYWLGFLYCSDTAEQETKHTSRPSSECLL